MVYTIRLNGISVQVFRTDSNGWCLTIGTNTYAGYSRKKDAIAAIGNFI